MNEKSPLKSDLIGNVKLELLFRGNTRWRGRGANLVKIISGFMQFIFYIDYILCREFYLPSGEYKCGDETQIQMQNCKYASRISFRCKRLHTHIYIYIRAHTAGQKFLDA